MEVSSLGFGVVYLISRRPGSRGAIGIGFLVIALFSGGIGTANFSELTHLTLSHPQTSTAPKASSPDEAPAQGFAILASLEMAEHLAQPRIMYWPASEASGAWVTHYGENFNGHSLGCRGFGNYSSDDPTIVAVSPKLYADIPCGTLLEVCGPGGCQIAARKDACPGCSSTVFDMSEAGMTAVCGPGAGVCTATVRKIAACQNLSFTAPERAPLRKPAELITAAIQSRPALAAPLAPQTEPPPAPVCVAPWGVVP